MKCFIITLYLLANNCGFISYVCIWYAVPIGVGLRSRFAGFTHLSNFACILVLLNLPSEGFF